LGFGEHGSPVLGDANALFGVLRIQETGSEASTRFHQNLNTGFGQNGKGTWNQGDATLARRRFGDYTRNNTHGVSPGLDTERTS
jgi:hypothetical protein